MGLLSHGPLHTTQLEMGNASGLTAHYTIFCGPFQARESDITPPSTRLQESRHIFLMFGQEARLPVDFLLGSISEPIEGEIHEWVLEHQTRLQVAFEGARERLRVAAKKRKEQHDLLVRDAPLTVGQLVYLRNYGVRGRHKISDLWSPVLFQILRAPEEGGVVYTIAPADDLTQVRTVHRSLIKGRLGSESEAPDEFEHRSDPEENPPPLEESSLHLEEEDVDLVMLIW